MSRPPHAREKVLDAFESLLIAEGERAATMDAITKQLHDVLGKEPVVHAHVDADLIGGVTLRIGDQLIDGSVATQLRKLEQELKHSGSHEIREHPERFLGEIA